MNKKLLAICLLGTTIFFTGCTNSVSSVNSVEKTPTTTQTSFSVNVGLKFSASYVDENTISVDMVYSWIDEKEKQELNNTFVRPPIVNQLKYIALLEVNKPVSLDNKYELELKKDEEDSLRVVLSKYVEEPRIISRGIFPKMIPFTIHTTGLTNLKSSKTAYYDSTRNISQ